jgi:hypothetical protein
MSYDEAANEHERLMWKFFLLQRRYAALEGRDDATRRRRSRVLNELTAVHLELERLRRTHSHE